MRMDPRASVDLFEDEQRRVFRLPETTKTNRKTVNSAHSAAPSKNK